MKVPLLLIIGLLLAATAPAQNSNTLLVKAGTTIKESIPPAELYHFAAFRTGKVYFKDGRSAAGLMNYHRLLDELQFINSKGDTLAVDNEPTIELVVLDRDTFYYDGSFIKLLHANGDTKLGVKQWLKLIDRQKTGGYDQPSTTSAITAFSSYDDGRRLYDLVVREDLILNRELQYYFGNKFNRFVPVTRKNVYDLFPKHEAALTEYLKTEKVDFKKGSDLQKLFTFLAQL
jgi:hypothetical protein